MSEFIGLIIVGVLVVVVICAINEQVAEITAEKRSQCAELNGRVIETYHEVLCLDTEKDVLLRLK